MDKYTLKSFSKLITFLIKIGVLKDAIFFSKFVCTLEPGFINSRGRYYFVFYALLIDCSMNIYRSYINHLEERTGKWFYLKKCVKILCVYQIYTT